MKQGRERENKTNKAGFYSNKNLTHSPKALILLSFLKRSEVGKTRRQSLQQL